MNKCVNSILTKQAMAKKVLSYHKNYEIDNSDIKRVDAPLLYKTILHLTTHATDRHSRVNLHELTSFTVCETNNIARLLDLHQSKLIRPNNQ